MTFISSNESYYSSFFESVINIQNATETIDIYNYINELRIPFEYLFIILSIGLYITIFSYLRTEYYSNIFSVCHCSEGNKCS